MKYFILAAVGAVALAAPAAAAHLDHLDTPYPTRGACESAVAGFNGEVRDGLLQQFPMFFSNAGEVSSFLTRAFPCELQPDGNWYIQDDRIEVLQSDWYRRRK